MIAQRWKAAAVWFLIVATAAAIFLMHRADAGLRAQLAELRRRNATGAQLQEENQRTRELLARAERDKGDANEALHSELLRVQTEVRELEEKAHLVAVRQAAAAAALAAAAAALAANHDPEKGLARLEDFQNVGRGTPSAAVQTLVWAALKGDDSALVAALSVTGAAREKAGALLAALPEAARAKYAAPENLAALVVTGVVLDAEAAQILGTTFVDGQHAIVGLRLPDSEQDQKVPVELGPDGWQIVVPPKMIDKLAKQINPPPVPPAVKK